MAEDEPGATPTRLLALSDGVFAIAITILVLNVDLSGVPTDSAVTSEMILREWRDVFSYVLSFLVVGNFWMDHRQVFEHVTTHTPLVAWLNMLLLMAVAFLPFPTSLVGDDGGLPVVVFYAASMTVTGLLLYVLWWYVSRESVGVVAGVDAGSVRQYRRRYLVTPFVFGVSVPVALLVGPTPAFVCWGSLFVLLPAVTRYYRDE